MKPWEITSSLSELKGLEYFAEDSNGQLIVDPNLDIPPIIDMHSHMGWSYSPYSKLDVRSVTKKVKFWYDYDDGEDVLQREDHPTPKDSRRLLWEILTGFVTLQSNKTHTARNLRLEMDRMGHSKACILPIATPPIMLYLAKRNIEDTFEAACFDPSRFIPFAAVDLFGLAWGKDKEDSLNELFKIGAMGVKYHPEFQLAAPNGTVGLGLLKWCRDNKKIVLAHTGDTEGNDKGGDLIMKLFAQFSSPKAYRAALPKLNLYSNNKLKIIFAHAGLKHYKCFIDIANEYSACGHDVYLETSGQPVPHLRYILDNFDPKKILYGNDWPFYPLAVSLARMLGV